MTNSVAPPIRCTFWCYNTMRIERLLVLYTRYFGKCKRICMKEAKGDKSYRKELGNYNLTQSLGASYERYVGCCTRVLDLDYSTCSFLPLLWLHSMSWSNTGDNPAQGCVKVCVHKHSFGYLVCNSNGDRGNHTCQNES